MALRAILDNAQTLRAGDFAFELFDCSSENVLAAFEHLHNRGVDLGLLSEIGGARIGLRDRSRLYHGLKGNRSGGGGNISASARGRHRDRPAAPSRSIRETGRRP